jgi:hypothetical protein
MLLKQKKSSTFSEKIETEILCNSNAKMDEQFELAKG